MKILEVIDHDIKAWQAEKKNVDIEIENLEKRLIEKKGRSFECARIITDLIRIKERENNLE